MCPLVCGHSSTETSTSTPSQRPWYQAPAIPGSRSTYPRQCSKPWLCVTMATLVSTAVLHLSASCKILQAWPGRNYGESSRHVPRHRCCQRRRATRWLWPCSPIGWSMMWSRRRPSGLKSWKTASMLPYASNGESTLPPSCPGSASSRTMLTSWRSSSQGPQSIDWLSNLCRIDPHEKYGNRLKKGQRINKKGNS